MYLQHPFFQGIDENNEQIIYHFRRPLSKFRWFEYQIIEPLNLNQKILPIVEVVSISNLDYVSVERRSESIENHLWIHPFIEELNKTRKDRAAVRKALS